MKRDANDLSYYKNELAYAIAEEDDAFAIYMNAKRRRYDLQQVVNALTPSKKAAA